MWKTCLLRSDEIAKLALGVSRFFVSGDFMMFGAKIGKSVCMYLCMYVCSYFCI